MANVKHVLLIFLMVTIIGSCDILNNGDRNNFAIEIDNDFDTLNERIQLVNEPIVLDSTLSKSQFTKPEYSLVANVKSPKINGKRLSATSIELRANKVYISYHLYGNEYAGAVDIIDIKDEDKPCIISTAYFKNADINALDIEENGKKLWVTGGRDINTFTPNSDEQNGAMLGELHIDKDKFDDDDYREVPLPSFSGNDIVDAPGNKLFVATGATGGGYFEVDKGRFKVTNSIYKNFAKSIDRRQGDIIGLNLANDHKATFTIMDYNNNSVDDINTPFTVAPVDGKNVLEHRASITYAALGDQGVKGYKFNNESEPVYEFKPLGEDVSNGVTVDGQYVYIANGTDGLFITTIASSGNKEPEEVYSWKGGNGSANFVKTDGNFIILANGIDGLNILKKGKK